MQIITYKYVEYTIHKHTAELSELRAILLNHALNTNTNKINNGDSLILLCIQLCSELNEVK